MARNDPQLNLRLPSELKDKLENAAKSNSRSLTAEVNERLAQSFSPKRMNEISERRKLEVLSDYVAWCETRQLDSKSSFRAYASAYEDTLVSGAIDHGIELNAAVDHIDSKYLSELFRVWILESSEKFLERVDSAKAIVQPTAIAGIYEKLNEMAKENGKMQNLLEEYLGSIDKDKKKAE